MQATLGSEHTAAKLCPNANRRSEGSNGISDLAPPRVPSVFATVCEEDVGSVESEEVVLGDVEVIGGFGIGEEVAGCWGARERWAVKASLISVVLTIATAEYHTCMFLPSKHTAEMATKSHVRQKEHTGSDCKSDFSYSSEKSNGVAEFSIPEHYLIAAVPELQTEHLGMLATWAVTIPEKPFFLDPSTVPPALVEEVLLAQFRAYQLLKYYSGPNFAANVPPNVLSKISFSVFSVSCDKSNALAVLRLLDANSLKNIFDYYIQDKRYLDVGYTSVVTICRIHASCYGHAKEKSSIGHRLFVIQLTSNLNRNTAVYKQWLQCTKATTTKVTKN